MAKIPLLKRTHLITIVLIALVFMVLRFSGGKLSFSSGSTNNPEEDAAVEAKTQAEQKAEKEIRDEEASLIKEQLVKDVLTNIEVEKEKKKERVIGESLADIERKVGLK
jgi:hypothetical protein